MLEAAMPRGPYARSDGELKALLSRAPGGKAGYKQLVRELGLGGGRERRLLVEQMERMVARGELVRMERGVWALPSTKDNASRGSSSGRPGAFISGRERLVSGRLELHRDGFGFVRPDASAKTAQQAGTPLAGADIFIPPNELNGAMGGDLVLVDEAPPDRSGRRSGRIARVLTRRNPTVVGIFHAAQNRYGKRGRREFRGAGRGSESATFDFASLQAESNFITPLDERVGGIIVIPDGAEVVETKSGSPHRTLGSETPERWTLDDGASSLDGYAVDVEITRFPQPGRPALGRVVEVLGPPDAFGVDVEIIIRKHHLPHVFPPAVLKEAEKQSKRTVNTLSPEELARREDFRELPMVTIDGESARDFDDAVLVRLLPNGNTELQVHIADVSTYVTPASALDTEARVRGTSVYFPDRAVPMLPHALSSGMCSLLPGEDRLVLSCIMQVDAQGEVAGYRLAEGIIRSGRRCTYTSVQQCLDAITENAAAEDIAERERVALENPELSEAFDRMLELAQRLNAKRVRRGSIDFDLPEPMIEFDPDGNMKAIVRSERGWAHRLIEEFMLSANECVAAWLEAKGISSLYRIHEMPDAKRILEFEELAAGFGQTLGVGALPIKRFTMKGDRRTTQRNAARGRGSRDVHAHEIPEKIPVTPQMYQKLIRNISGHPEERILSYLMLRSLKQARYSEMNEGHFALAAKAYTHFTSPIRRYPDLIVHRLVRAMLRDEKQAEPIAAAELHDIAVESSQAERRAADAERELIEWKKMKFMADKIGDDFSAMVLSVTKYGFFVELNDLFIEGLVPIGSLPGDHWMFRETDRTICGARTGFCFRPGQRIHVILDRIDRMERRLQFALAPGTEPFVAGGRMNGTRDKEHESHGAKRVQPKRSAKTIKREKRSKRKR